MLWVGILLIVVIIFFGSIFVCVVGFFDIGDIIIKFVFEVFELFVLKLIFNLIFVIVLFVFDCLLDII